MKEKIIKINDFVWEIPKTARDRMSVPARIYASKRLLDEAEDEAVKQLTNVACLPGVVKYVPAMPDMHWGYGLPMGAVGVFDSENGVISSGCTGFDINCGIHMIKTNLTEKEVRPKIKELIDTLFKDVPSGVGSTGRLKVNNTQLEDILVRGARWAVENGYGVDEDLERMEENGSMLGGDPSKVSGEAKKRGSPQLGTLGAGNHFLEVQSVDRIYDPNTAKIFGIEKECQVVIMLHCGSRGFGHQVASDYLKIHEKASKKYGIWLPDPQLVCAPVNSQEGQDYFKAMVCAVNYAFTNRLVMTHWIRESFEKVFKKKWEEMEMHTIYDVCHNICKIEEHEVDGKIRKLYVHRKGATRALPPGHELVPKIYRKVGQPVLIAGSMGTASYILVGTEKAKETFYSTCHGAGRTMSRTGAIKTRWGEDVKRDLERKGIIAKATHPKVLSEEAPEAYKDIDEVIRSVDGAGISRPVARMVPLGVAKG
ncbi:MAG: RtcB family protein [Candidatus Aenigmatarchaeota archaeon]